MFDKYQMVLLGLVVSYGVSLTAMDKPTKSNELTNSGKIKQSVAVKVLMDRTNPLRCSDEICHEKVQKNTYCYKHAGRAWSQEHYPTTLSRDPKRDMYPYAPIY